MFGGGGLNPRKMQQMMKQMGIDVEELDAEEVIIRTADEELYFDGAQVTKMDAQGQETYQIVGEPNVREKGEAEAIEAGDEAADEELYFDGAQVTKMDAQGQETYQVVGEPNVREKGEAEAIEAGDEDAEAADEGGIPDADVEIVAQRAGVTESTARKVLEENDGDLAAAVSQLE